GDYFSVLGTKAAIGRLLIPSDDVPGTNAAVLSFPLWQRLFGGSPGALGTTIMLNGNPFVVVGVAQKGFRGSTTNAAFDVWVPLATQPHTLSRLSRGVLEDRTAGWLGIFGRLKPGVDFQGAEAEMKALAAQIAAAYPATNAGRSVNTVRGIGLDPGD